MSSSVATRSRLLQCGIVKYLVLLLFLNPTLGFTSVLSHHLSFARSTPFLAKGKTPYNNDDNDDEKPLLTDLDSRVLQTMLQENDKLDLRQEANLKKLLERAVAPKTADPYRNIPSDDNDNVNSPFSSTLFKVSSSSYLILFFLQLLWLSQQMDKSVSIPSCIV